MVEGRLLEKPGGRFRSGNRGLSFIIHDQASTRLVRMSEKYS